MGHQWVAIHGMHHRQLHELQQKMSEARSAADIRQRRTEAQLNAGKERMMEMLKKSRHAGTERDLHVVVTTGCSESILFAFSD